MQEPVQGQSLVNPSQSLVQSLMPKKGDFGGFIGKEGVIFLTKLYRDHIDMIFSEMGYSELVQRLFEKMTFFLVDPLMYDHQFMGSDLVIKSHDSYSWYRFWTIKALVEAAVLNDGFSVICRGMVARAIDHSQTVICPIK